MNAKMSYESARALIDSEISAFLTPDESDRIVAELPKRSYTIDELTAYLRKQKVSSRAIRSVEKHHRMEFSDNPRSGGWESKPIRANKLIDDVRKQLASHEGWAKMKAEKLIERAMAGEEPNKLIAEAVSPTDNNPETDQMLVRGLDAGNYDAAYRGGDWQQQLRKHKEHGNEAFAAAYAIGFITGADDNFDSDEDYLHAVSRWGRRLKKLGKAID